jgi:hypothetical protein
VIYWIDDKIHAIIVLPWRFSGVQLGIRGAIKNLFSCDKDASWPDWANTIMDSQDGVFYTLPEGKDCNIFHL